MTDMAASLPPASSDAVGSPPLAPATSAPLCYVVDEEASIRHFLSLVLHGSGVDTMEFADGAALRRALENRIPDLVFHNIALDATDAVESVVALGKCDFRGSVQLMSNRGAAVLEHVKNIGSQQHISMLPVLKKPFETDAIVKILHELKIGMPAGAGARLSLDEAIDKNWIEFWYQPKIALRKKQLAGAEAYARARHPQNGVVMPAAFMPDASDAAVLKLSELALHSALKAGQNFSKMGIHLRLTVNIPLAALAKLPVEQIVTSQRPSPNNWPGLIVDVPEDQIVADLPLAIELAKKLETINIRMAIDDCGRAYSMLSGLAEFPFTEVKLDRAFVADCGTDKVNAPLCKAMINLAHHFGRTAVAMGIEKAPDAVAMVSMGCDFGQGFLLGLPMAEERFISLLRQRSGVRAEQPAAAG